MARKFAVVLTIAISVGTIPPAQAAPNNPPLVRNLNVIAERDPKQPTDVIVEWSSPKANTSFTVMLGTVRNIKTGEKPPSPALGYQTFNVWSGSQVIQSLYYSSSYGIKKIPAVDRWIYSVRFSSFKENDLFAYVVTTNAGGQAIALDFAIVPNLPTTQDRVDKLLCNIAVVGLPIAQTTLSLSKLTLDAFVFVPGTSAAARKGLAVISAVEFATGTGGSATSLINVNYQVESTGSDVKVGQEVNVESAKPGVTRMGKVVKVVKVGTKVVRYVVQVKTTINEARTLLNTVRGFSAQVQDGKAVCNALP